MFTVYLKSRDAVDAFRLYDKQINNNSRILFIIL